MATITLDQASAIIDAALAKGAEVGAAPLTVAVLDPGGHLVAHKRQDGSGILRTDIATGKAWGALGIGASSRVIAGMAEQRPHLVGAFAALAGGRFVPAAGGVLIRAKDGELVGAVGISGDVSDVDEDCAVAGVEAVGFAADLDSPKYLSKR